MQTIPATKTDNELIAEFLGFTQKSYTPESEKMWCDPKHGLPVGELKFDTSWDWLMPVVEKMQDVHIVNDRIFRTGAEVTIYYKACEIEYSPDEDSGDEHDEFQCHTKGETKIEAVYKAVVEFIKWHNSQKK